MEEAIETDRENKLTDFVDALERDNTNLKLSDEKYWAIVDEIKDKNTLSLESHGLSNIKTIPDELSLLTDLKTLNLSGQDLIQLPQTITTLTKLEFLSIDRNKLESIPAAIDNLKNLKGISANSNKLKDLPKEMGSLKELRTASFANNINLTTVPEELPNLNNLNMLRLDGTPFGRQIEDITYTSSVAINNKKKQIKYYFDNRRHYLYIKKAIVAKKLGLPVEIQEYVLELAIKDTADKIKHIQ